MGPDNTYSRGQQRKGEKSTSPALVGTKMQLVQGPPMAWSGTDPATHGEIPMKEPKPTHNLVSTRALPAHKVLTSCEVNNSFPFKLNI